MQALGGRCLEEPVSKENSRLERSERRNTGLHIVGQSRTLAGKMGVLKRVIARAGFLPGFFMLICPNELGRVCRRPRPCHLKRRKRCVCSGPALRLEATLIAKFLPQASYALTRRSALRLGLARAVPGGFFVR